MERSSPRTATSEEVTSTAQIAICTTSKMSRTEIRRPTTLVDPDFTTWYGSVRSTCLTGTAPNRNPLAKLSRTATA